MIARVRYATVDKLSAKWVYTEYSPTVGCRAAGPAPRRVFVSQGTLLTEHAQSRTADRTWPTAARSATFTESCLLFEYLSVVPIDEL